MTVKEWIEYLNDIGNEVRNEKEKIFYYDTIDKQWYELNKEQVIIASDAFIDGVNNKDKYDSKRF